MLANHHLKQINFNRPVTENRIYIGWLCMMVPNSQFYRQQILYLLSPQKRKSVFIIILIPLNGDVWRLMRASPQRYIVE